MEGDFKPDSSGHYGKEIHTRSFFWKKQKAIYPIIGLCLIGLTMGAYSTFRHALYNKSVVFSRKNIVEWNKDPNRDLKVYYKNKPEKIAPDADLNQ